MKILSTFDTKLDEKILKEKLEKTWKAFIIKRHWLYLWNMFIFAILMLLIFMLLFIVLSKILDTTSFWIITSLNILGIWLWLVLTFYQLLKYLSKYQIIKTKVHDSDLKDWLFEKYFKFSLFLFLYQVVLTIITTILALSENKNINWNEIITGILWNIAQVSISLLFLYFIYKILYVLVNFEMDFVIVTHHDISFYNQSWLTKRQSKTISVDKIKSIQANKKGIIRALFDFWEVIILTEWDEAGKWEMVLKYIPKPEIIKNKIANLMNLKDE